MSFNRLMMRRPPAVRSLRSTAETTVTPLRFIRAYMLAVAAAVARSLPPPSLFTLDVAVVVVVVVPPVAEPPACAEVVVTVPLRPKCRLAHGPRRRPHSRRKPSRNLDDMRLYRMGLSAEFMYNMMRLKNSNR